LVSPTRITANVNVVATAIVGPRNVSVTNADGQTGTLPNGFTVLAGSAKPPTITSVSPNSGAPGQSNINVVINGTNFLPSPSCDFDSDEGLTVSACTYNSATKITATLSIAANAVVGGHNVVVTDTDGQSASLINGFTVTSGSGGGVSFGSGFTAGSMVVNGSASISGSTLTVTPNVQSIAGSAWFPTAVNIQSFTTDFSFQDTAGANIADGLTFAIQNNSTSALGLTGGSLGYQTIGNSVAVKFDLYSNAGEGPSSTGLFTNGADPTVPAQDTSAAGIDLHSGHVFKVHMTYDGTNLAMTVTDATTAAVFSKTWPVNIPSTVGNTSAFVGFTGGTGGLTALQQILSWTMTSGSGGGGGAVATPTFSEPGGTYLGTQTVSLSDTTTGATIFYTLDGTQPGTTAGGSTKQYSGALSVTSTETINALATASGMTTSGVANATYTIESQVATPTFSPVGGNYTSAQNVTISTISSGATIHYTTDGSTPTVNSTVYSGPVVVSASETLKAIATQSGFFDSNVGSATYTISSGGGGGGGINFTNGFTAGSMALNGNAAINGTTLAVTPNAQTQAGSAWFPTPVNIQSFTTDFNFQDTAGANTADGMTFTIQGNSTTALGGSGGKLGYGNILNSVAVKFDLYSNAGEGPDSTGLYLSALEPTTPAVDMSASGIDLHSGHVFKVHMMYDGTNLAMTVTDATTAAVFTQTWPVNIPGTVGANTAYVGFTGGTGGFTALQQILSWTMTSGSGSGGGTVATPTFSEPGGTYLGTQTVSLSDTTSGATIFYTLDGTQPGTAAGGSTAQYSGPINVTSTETIKALATASGMTASGTASATYTIESQVATPTFSPVGGSYSSAQNVTISTTTSGAAIHYTKDGSTPTASSTLYSGPVAVSASETLKAIAMANGFFDSNVGSATYTINAGTVATPTFSEPGGTYLGTQTVSLSDSTSGATIFYTLDGTQPGTAAGGSTKQYSGALTVASTETIKALATASGMTTSATATATYTIQSQAATPTFSPVGGNYTSTQNVTISTTTSGATIRYTTDGSTPTATSTLYGGPVVVSATETLKAIAIASGFFNSNVGSASYTITSGSGGGINFSGGFTAGSMAVNGSAAISGTALTVTTNTQSVAGSAWYPTPVNVQSFTTDFSYQGTAGTNTADGLTFTIQGNSTTAIGGSGGRLGYGGIGKSVAIKLDLYNNQGEGPDSTGLYLSALEPTTPAVDMSASGIDLHSGHVFKVHMTYDGTNLAMSITDATTAAVFTQTWAVNIPGTVGGTTAYVGFTGGTGGFTALQQILSWTMTSP
jgi:hypothetical protein